jgi:hypothetical protein
LLSLYKPRTGYKCRGRGSANTVICSVLHEELLEMQQTYNLQLIYCNTASTAVYIEINLLLEQEECKTCDKL